MFKGASIFTGLVLAVYAFFCLFISKGTCIVITAITMPFIGIVIFAVYATINYLFCKKERTEIKHCQESIQESIIKIRMVKALTTDKSTGHVIDSNYQIQTKTGG